MRKERRRPARPDEKTQIKPGRIYVLRSGFLYFNRLLKNLWEVPEARRPSDCGRRRFFDIAYTSTSSSRNTTRQETRETKISPFPL